MEPIILKSNVKPEQQVKPAGYGFGCYGYGALCLGWGLACIPTPYGLFCH